MFNYIEFCLILSDTIGRRKYRRQLSMNDVSKLLPLIKFYAVIAFVCALAILLGILNIITGEEITHTEKLLSAYNFVLVVIVIIFCVIVRKEFKLIRKHINRLKSAYNVAGIDPVCNLRNKYKFINDGEIFIERNPEKSFALIHFDISKFTIINNTVGYKVGDKILQQIGKTLQDILADEITGKGEGDNFFAVVEYKDQEEVVDKALEVSDKIEELKIWQKIKIKPVIKIGIFYVNRDDLDLRTAIERAYFAKITLKNNYKSEYVIYNDKIGSELIEAKRMEDEMHKALERKEFKVYFQPKVNLRTGEITGAEALVRWEHPKLGTISPARFIPIFEKNGFIIKLDKYVFEEVCKNIRKWINEGYHVVPVSVNVSRVHFLTRNFVSDYSEIKRKYRIHNRLIEIEITESIAFSNENVDEVFSVMREFREAGFDISIDDFGSGYSSLGLLKAMPVNTLKLDKMFLNDIEDYNAQVIVSNIVNMAKNLNLMVVSEGVETETQVDFLKGIGCDIAQGYVFAKPVPVNIFETFISNGKAKYY